MSGALEHRECADALAAYALGAVPDAEAARLRRHLDDCHRCRAELDWLRVAVDVLPASVPQIEPSPQLRGQVMEIVEAESAVLEAAADRPKQQRRRRWSLSVPVAVALGLAFVIAATGIVVLVATNATGTRTIQAQITGPALAARAAVSLHVSGARATLIVRDLPAPSADHVDQLWVVRDNGAPEPAGTFVVQSGSIEVGRPVHRGDLVLVTVERGRGSRAPTTHPFIIAKA